MLTDRKKLLLSSSSSQPIAFNPSRQEFIDEEAFDHNSCLRKVLLGFEGTPVDNHSNLFMTMINTSPPVCAFGCMNTLELMSSSAPNQYNSYATSQIFYEKATSPVFMDASPSENHTKLEYIFHTHDTWRMCPSLRDFTF